MLYELGEGVPRDRQQAIYWLRMAGSQGDGRSQWIADWLADPSTPHFTDEMQLANYIDAQVAAYYQSQLPPASSVAPTSSQQCWDNATSIAWSATCRELKREGK
jgi:TPR repeat protein